VLCKIRSGVIDSRLWTATRHVQRGAQAYDKDPR